MPHKLSSPKVATKRKEKVDFDEEAPPPKKMRGSIKPEQIAQISAKTSQEQQDEDSDYSSNDDCA